MGQVVVQSVKGTIISYSGAFIGFLTTFFILTAFLSPEEIGLTRVLLEAANLLSALAMLGMTSSIYRFFPYFKEEQTHSREKPPKHHGFFYYIMKVALCGGLLITLIYILLSHPIGLFFSKNSALFLDYYYSVIPLTFFLLFWLVFEVYAVQMMRLAVPKFIREVLLRLLLIAVYLVYAFRWIDLRTMIFLFIGVYGLCMFVSFLYLRKIAYTGFYHDKSFLTPAIKSSFIKYTALYVIASFGSTLASRMDLFMVSSLDTGGLYAAGVFSIAFFIASVIEIPSRSILSISTPRMSEAMKDNNIVEANRLYKQVSLYQLMIGGILFLIIWFNIHNVFAILPNGENYKGGVYVVFFLGLSKLVDVTFNYSHPIVSCSKYYHWNLYYTGIVTAISIILNIWFISRWGITGAAVATLITMLCGYGFQQLLLLRYLKVHPFSPALFKLFVVFLGLIGVNPLLPCIANPWLDLLLRSLILLTIAFSGLYFLRLTPEVFDILGGKLRHKKTVD
ncbi:polysaccharide biosynthesis protein [Porphyromonas macacae]|uniref:lipopolysaccharide biosynthesis protein n=1 Tax=Porphyromonas macacae TaxID=28115 RepID=UPI00052BB89F|nr:polysaccharide biosynthesis C-terminal domain-containing protein [Porphyromonas macacae]KGO00533.1 polysaccharide biosynthesis protein [Porphyromonas macacae]